MYACMYIYIYIYIYIIGCWRPCTRGSGSSSRSPLLAGDIRSGSTLNRAPIECSGIFLHAEHRSSVLDQPQTNLMEQATTKRTAEQILDKSISLSLSLYIYIYILYIYIYIYISISIFIFNISETPKTIGLVNRHLLADSQTPAWTFKAARKGCGQFLF